MTYTRRHKEWTVTTYNPRNIDYLGHLSSESQRFLDALRRAQAGVGA